MENGNENGNGGSPKGKIDRIGAVKVAKGAGIGLGGNAQGVTVITILLEWNLVPDAILAKPTSLALSVAVLGVVAGVALNLGRKMLTHYPAVQQAVVSEIGGQTK